MNGSISASGLSSLIESWKMKNNLVYQRRREYFKNSLINQIISGNFNLVKEISKWLQYHPAIIMHINHVNRLPQFTYSYDNNESDKNSDDKSIDDNKDKWTL